MTRDFTFVCPTEIIAFNDAIPEFKAIDTEVLGKFYVRLLCTRRPDVYLAIQPFLPTPISATSHGLKQHAKRVDLAPI